MYRVYRNQAAAAYSSLFHHFSFSNFQTFNVFVTLFSGTVRPRRLKLSSHVDSGQMFRIYGNKAAALIRPFIFHFSFSSIFFVLLFLHFDFFPLFSYKIVFLLR